MRRFSIIIPVYNRPDELAELLETLARQTYPYFEVVVVEDGSQIRAEAVAKLFAAQMAIHYYEKPNSGQGFARNYGMQRATGDWFIILDSDALVEPNYLEIVNREIDRQKLDLFGGPDRDHPSFSPIQKAISYSMTSLFTTGGIRGKAKNAGGTFHPRSFNMGLSRNVWEETGGFRITRMGEDIIFSIKALSLGFKSALIPEAFIYHKRRSNFPAFFRQLKFFGRARINITRFFPDTLKLVHFFPAAFTVWIFSFPLQLLIFKPLFQFSVLVLLMYCLMIFFDSWRQNKSITVASLSIQAVFVQMIGYGTGFISEGWKYLREPKGTIHTGEQVDYPSA
ncbi:glycosyltransferase [Siphonobacter sp. SORGH_AS_0500]|uniref:glycosyltransferase n=1 Tax=Siphonobacter sp. SORGH_AS_0500 TaxID=1864824 RepID=UPI00285DFB33|nr:glycosyltransferase [Siphonobacter sp. SORGH_AS_0500]MDR6195507.1 glycosyltransferase involved in cell wall biosynthesis [Siphonobacter sp. SORGH_AS_0500]